jgi:hypothetical protein
MSQPRNGREVPRPLVRGGLTARERIPLRVVRPPHGHHVAARRRTMRHQQPGKGPQSHQGLYRFCEPWYARCTWLRGRGTGGWGAFSFPGLLCLTFVSRRPCAAGEVKVKSFNGTGPSLQKIWSRKPAPTPTTATPASPLPAPEVEDVEPKSPEAVVKPLHASTPLRFSVTVVESYKRDDQKVLPVTTQPQPLVR